MKKRNTQGKSMVLELLKNSNHALCHENIENELEGELDRVTIYRILQNFHKEGLIHKIMDVSGKSYFACCRGCTESHHLDNHLHFRCKSCGKIKCLEINYIPKLPSGYQTEEVYCMVQGYCPECNSTKD